MFYLFFFFQAEDGIRDGRVTGVQTCALPIYHVPEGQVDAGLEAEQLAFLRQIQTDSSEAERRPILSGARPEDHPEEDVGETRSEERRVGKECRSRGAA